MADGGDPRVAAQTVVRALRDRISKLDDDGNGLILCEARSHYAWTDSPVPDDLLREIYQITINGPTSMNTCPAHFVFVRSAKVKHRLAKSLKAKNIDKMMATLVTAIIAWDPAYWQRLDFLFPHEDRKPLFKGKPDYIHDTAYRNSTLQGAYFMFAARA